MTRLLLALAGLVAAVFMVGSITGAVETRPATASSTSSSSSTTTSTRPASITSSTMPVTTTSELVPPATVPPATVPPATVPPATVPTVPEPTRPSGVEQWRGLAAGYDWNVDILLCLMAFESGGNPNAYNASSGASGLMQVLASWADNFGYAPADLFVPEVNLSISHALYVDGGWSHWSPWNRGECH